MKIAFSTSGKDVDAPLDMRFGRAANFLVYDTGNGKFEIVPNTQNLNAAQGAGIQAAQHVAGSGAEAVVCGHCGPKAFAVLKAAGIRVYTCEAATVSNALKAFREGTLKELPQPDVAGHWA